MNRSALAFLAVSLIAAAFCASSVRAQAQPAQQPVAQDSMAPPAIATAPPSKRVWTNEDLSQMDPHVGVSTVGKADAAKPGQKPNPSAKNRDGQWYRDQIAKLQSQIESLDKQIAEIQATLDGKPTGDGARSTRPSGVRYDSWQNELAQLTKKRDNLRDQIAALQEQARHAGVPTNAIPQ
jgi:peptidoglycan hydrolase CwlO-like protein